MSDNNSDIQGKVNEKFKNNVKKWLSIDDEIREIRAKCKKLTNDKKEFEENILKYLDEVNEKEFLVHDGKLRKNVYKSKAPLSKESIQKALNELIKDKTQVTTMTDHIIKSRPLVERVNLKRTKNRSND
jgi:uncharacterized coiled-coil DUF342 family protein